MNRLLPVVGRAGVFLVSWFRGAEFWFPGCIRALAASAASSANEAYASHDPVFFFVNGARLGRRTRSPAQFASWLLVAALATATTAVMEQAAARRATLASGLAS